MKGNIILIIKVFPEDRFWISDFQKLSHPLHMCILRDITNSDAASTLQICRI